MDVMRHGDLHGGATVNSFQTIFFPLLFCWEPREREREEVDVLFQGSLVSF